ncbi:MAG: FecR domain-containing protein [Bacteroides sp.]|nr:FecR domain-containing protein [Bacteroides sp.]
MDQRIIKYFSGELNQNERIQLLRDIDGNNELKEEFASCRNIQGLVSLIAQPHDKEEGKLSYQDFMVQKQSKSSGRPFMCYFKYVAAILLLISGSWIAAYFYYHTLWTDGISYNTIQVPAGQYASLTLSDGTEVWMNARSSLTYPSLFKGKERRIELTGEAYFKVTENKERPFVVSTSTLHVKVLGTTFNVKNNKGSSATDVSLLNGSVEVTLTRNPSKPIRLQPMQNLNYDNKKIKITHLQDENDFLWKQGILFFDELPLSEIAKRIEWHYDTKIIIENPKIGQQIYSGKFRQQDGPHEILRIIRKSNYFRYEKDDVNNVFVIK